MGDLSREHMHQPLAEGVCQFTRKLSFYSAAKAREPVLPKYKEGLGCDVLNIAIICEFVCAMAHLIPCHTGHTVLLDCSLRPVP